LIPKINYSAILKFLNSHNSKSMINFNKRSQIILFAISLILNLTTSDSISAENYTFKRFKFGGTGFVTGVITCPTEKNLIYTRTDVGGAYRWIEATQSWKPLLDWTNMVGYLGVESLAVDPSSPNKVYMLVGTSYYNNGATAILCSTNYGESFTMTDVTPKFQAHGNGTGREAGERLAVDPNSGNILFCGTRTKGLWKSIDSGATWTKVSSYPGNPVTPNGNGVCFVQFDKSSSNTGEATKTIYIGVSTNIATNVYASYDAGTTWEAVTGFPTNFYPHRCLLTSKYLYVTYGDSPGPGSLGRIFRLDKTTKTATGIYPDGNSRGGITVDPENENNVVMTTDGVYGGQPWIIGGSFSWGDDYQKSTDGGNTWSNFEIGNGRALYVDTDIVWLKKYSQLHWAGDMKIDPFNRNRAFIISGNGLYMTNNLWDAKVNWKMAVNGLEESVPLDMVSIPGGPVVTAIGDYAGVVSYDPDKYYANHQPGLGTNTGVDYGGANNNFIVRAGNQSTINGVYNQLVYSEDTGATWNTFPTVPVGSQGNVAVNPDASIVVWSGGTNTSYYTANKGQSWSNISTELTTSTKVISDKVNSNIFYASTGNAIYTFTYTGSGFTVQKPLQTLGGVTSAGKRIAAAPGVEGEVWVPCGGSGLYVLTNKGANYSKNASIADCQCVAFGKTAPGKSFPTVFIWARLTGAAFWGAYRSIDRGVTWLRVNDDLHQFGGPGNGNFVVGDMNVFGRFYMSTSGLGLIYGDTDLYSDVKDLTEDNSGIRIINSNHQLLIECQENIDCSVYDLQGVKLKDYKNVSNIDLTNELKTGIYILNIKNVQTGKFVNKKILKF
jgi:hypothetical protein